MKTSAYLALLFPALLCHGAVYAAVYKWVDEQGVTHYSHAPPNNRNFTVVETQTGTSTSPDSKPPASGTSAPGQQAQPSTAAEPQLVDDEQCGRVAADVEKLANIARVRLKTDGGTKLLSEEEKQALITERREWLEKYCK